MSLGEPVVKRCDGDIATIGDFRPRFVRVNARARVVAGAGHLAGAGGADSAGTEARAGSVGDCCVEGGADDGDVVVFGGFDETFYGAEVGEAGDAGEGPLERS